jgi:hypothetical protein
MRTMLREYFNGTCVTRRSISTVYVSGILMLLALTTLQKKIVKDRASCNV